MPANAFVLISGSGEPPRFAKVLSSRPNEGFNWDDPAAPYTVTLDNGKTISGVGHTFIDCYFYE